MESWLLTMPATFRADGAAVKAELERAAAERADAQYFVERLALEAARARSRFDAAERERRRSPMPW